MDTDEVYESFIAKYQDYPNQLAALVREIKATLPKTAEDSGYNLGTMQKDVDIPEAENVVIANACEFKRNYEHYKKRKPELSDDEAKARVVFDFLRHHKSTMSYEANKDDILFGNTTRAQFYAKTIYECACRNTNFFNRHIGNIQMLCMEPKTENDLPRNTGGLKQSELEAFNKIPADVKLDILYKRGLYHEVRI